ncbi:MAG: 50S ribosomal protein L16 [Verrucomicrobia bacterium]|nr:50S ribosomal protein L16 [Verrucomicrobiota bacterium]
MALMPKRVKHRKSHRGSRAGLSSRGTAIHYGEFGLQSLGRGWLEARQIEAARVAINRHIKRRGKMWIRVFPDKPYTKKPAETRMGKGKGAPEGWVAVVRPGRVLFELEGVPVNMAQEAFRRAAAKLPFRTRFVSRHHA